MRRRLPDLLALALALAASLASAWVSSVYFERIPHLEDEFANLWEADVMATGRIALPSPPQPQSFLVPFVVDDHGLRFGKYPPGYPAALSLGARAGTPWLVNALLAGFSVWLIYRLGSRLAGKAAGVIAASLAAGSPMLMMLSGSLMSHDLSLFLTVAFCLAWFDLFPRGGGAPPVPAPLLIAVAGGSLGLMALTRPLTAVAVGLPFMVHSAFILIRGDGRRRARLLGMAAIAGALAALLLVWQWALTGDLFTNPYLLWWPYDKVGFGLGFGRMASGHNLHWAYINTRFSLRAGLHDLFGWPYISWLFLPFGLWALRRHRDGWLTFAVAPVLVLVYAAYWIGAWLMGPRYYYDGLGAMAVVSGAGIAWLAGWMSEAARGVRWRQAVVGVGVIVLMALNVDFYLPARLEMMRGLYGMDRERMIPLQQANLGRALVVVRTSVDWTAYGSLLTLTPPYAGGDLLLAYSRGRLTDARLAQLFADRPVYYYYTDTPYVLYRSPR